MLKCFVKFKALFKFNILLGWALRTTKMHCDVLGKQAEEKTVHKHQGQELATYCYCLVKAHSSGFLL